MNTSQRVRELLYAPFKEQGPIENVLEGQTLRKTTAFEVDGQERLLDFTPRPVKRKYLKDFPPYTQRFKAVYVSRPDFEVTVPHHSPLGSALHREYGKL
jgi:hypothetical protein